MRPQPQGQIRLSGSTTSFGPEGQEIRAWRAPGLHELARYNGRMFRVMARE